MRTTAFSILASLALSGAAAAQSTAFTYQGRLKNGTQVASGLHDFRFRLFDAASGGAQVGTTQCVDNVLVTEGLFTTTIDFGQQFATPNQRFLEIEVRVDAGLDCTDTTGFSPLTGRQALTAAPLANHAKSAFALDAPDGSPTNALIVGNNGFVGIGTTVPGFPLHIAGTFAVLGLQDTGPNSSQAGYVSYRNGTGTETAWVGYGTAGDPDFSIVNARTNGDIVLNPLGGGKVGIGTSSPQTALDVRGDIKLGSAGQYFAPSGEENLRIVRGKFVSSGAPSLGSGYACTHPSTGVYHVTFNTPFAAPPVVTATPEFTASNDTFAEIDAVFATGLNVFVIDRAGAPVDKPVNFIAIGPR